MRLRWLEKEPMSRLPVPRKFRARSIPVQSHEPANPLWTVPLSALPATRDRPFFSVSRRPPIVAAPIVAPPPKQEALAPPPPERPLLTLIGTIVSPKASVAMLQGSDAESISRLASGKRTTGGRCEELASAR